MTTPEPTPADLAAAAAFTLASGEWIQEDLLAEHFAAWRVEDRERCVTVLNEFSRELQTSDDYGSTYATVALHNAKLRINQLTNEAKHDP